MNGDAASLVLFGTLLALALLGPRLIDAKRARAYGQRWAATLILPNGARVASGVSLCAFAFDLTTSTGPLALVGVVHGFFAPAK